VYAKNNGIRIYSIAFANSMSAGGKQTLETLALSTGGKYYTASASNIADVYKQIAGDLNDIAGVDAAMNLSFKNVEVNGTLVSGASVFAYVPDTKTTWPNATITYKNQSTEWIPPEYQLHYDIGTLRINQVWQTEYRLKVNQTGLIKLFGSGSTIIFNNGNDSLTLPEVFITAVPNTTPLGLQTGTVSVTNLIPQSGNFTDTVPVTWNLYYSGFDTVTETYWYSYNNLPFVEFGSTGNIPNGTYFRSRTLDVTKFPPGEYRIKVIATAPGIPQAQDSGKFTILVKPEMANIWLK
jgi:hypothetical protein